jgi:hypothetical protein
MRTGSSGLRELEGGGGGGVRWFRRCRPPPALDRTNTRVSMIPRFSFSSSFLAICLVVWYVIEFDFEF